MPNAPARPSPRAPGAKSIADLRKLPPEKLLRRRGSGARMADRRRLGDSRRPVQAVRSRSSSTTRRSWSATTPTKARASRRAETPKEYHRQRAAALRTASPTACSRRYPAGGNDVPKTARDLTRDAAFGWHTWTWARLQARSGQAKAFYYYFDQHPDYPADSPQAGHGAPHGREVAYVFGHSTGGPAGSRPRRIT